MAGCPACLSARGQGFFARASVAALEWIAQGYGYELTSADVWAAFGPAKEAADRLGVGAELRARVRSIIGSYPRGEASVGRVLRGQLTDA